MLISIIIPCYRSEKTLRYVVEEIRSAILSRPGSGYQIILVNDCSPDSTLKVICELAKEDRNIIGIDLARNYGQNVARMAAIPFVIGDVAVCMDDDGQHPASYIYALVDKINEGYDLVYAEFERQKQSLFRRMVSHLHTFLQDMTGAKQKGIVNSPFMAWSSFALKTLKEYHSPFVSSGGYLMKCTSKVANVKVEQRKRISGRSGYTIRKLFELWLTEFTNFSQVPLRIAGMLGVVSSALGVFYGAIIVIRKLIHPGIMAGYTSTMAIMLFLSGIILLMMGLMGEYIGKIYMTISGQPQYIIRTTWNAPKLENIDEEQDEI